MEEGKTGASLGGKIYKKRLAIKGKGKRGGGRAIIAFVSSSNVFFMYGYSKNERATVTKKDKEGLQKMAGDLLGLTDNELDKAVIDKKLIEIKV